MATRLTNTEVLSALRALMKNPPCAGLTGSLAAYIVPTEDAHGSEYIACCDKRREFVSGFTGSSGMAVITSDKAALWTDGRYYLQAEKELDSNWLLMKDRLPETPSVQEWLNKVLPVNSQIGTDPFLMSQTQWRTLSDSLQEAGNSLVAVSTNLVDEVWGKSRPAEPKNLIFVHPVKHAGSSWQEKVAAVREKMSAKNAEVCVLTALDEIAWFLNLRGSDIEFNPVFFAYCIVTSKTVVLFVNDSRFDEDVKEVLNADKAVEGGIEIKPYGSVVEEFKNVVKNTTGKVWISHRSSHALVQHVPTNRLVSELTPVAHLKAIKNGVEITGMRSAQLKDCIALAEFFQWLEQEIPKGYLNEVTAADRLEKLRRERDEFVSLSFPTIAGSGPNGAIIHYRPEANSARKLDTKEMFLVDSGAQYRDGTTDVTRTYHFGNPSSEEIDAFTRVLKGHISLARAKFPNGTKGYQLDVLARHSLWSVGLNYLHGTGHGVGSFLNVHEGPAGIGWIAHPDQSAIKAGMIISDEPGYYEDGKYGVRIESLVLVQEAQLPHDFKSAGFLEFDVLTLFPIQTKLVNKSLLSNEEITWLNNFHRRCLEFIGPSLKHLGKMDAFDWLVKATQPI